MWTPSWFLTNWPDKNVILASYEADFAAGWGRKTRDIVGEHGEALGIELSKDSQAANRWSTSIGGGMVTAGVGGAITGRGADLLIIDDPIKNAEEAASDTVRRKIWDWWQSTAFTRLEPGASVLVIMTRWHESDLAGKLIKDDVAEGWDVINFPALAEGSDELGRMEGEALWPIRYPTARLQRIQRAVGSYFWSAMYQQRPTPYGGGMLKRSWFRIVSEASVATIKCRWWDAAASEEGRGQDPDYTVGALLGLEAGSWSILDVRRMRGTPKQVENLVHMTAQLDGPDVMIRMAQEPGASGLQVIDHFTRNVVPGFDFKGIRETGPKIERARPFSAAAEAGNIILLEGEWNEDFLMEAEQFPNGAHDDQIDAVSGAMSQLAMLPGFFPYDTDLDVERENPVGNAFGVMTEEF